MVRLRIFASIVSMLSLAVSLWVSKGPVTGEVLVALLAAAACLAVVSPFDAPDPPQRRRVLIASLAYVAILSIAMMHARADAAATGALMVALVLLTLLGIGLAGWAFATRNRRRFASYHGYYN